MKEGVVREGNVQELLVSVETGVELAGELALPEQEPKALMLMHPGSGPADRTNDGYFPPIRDQLLASACAVASFDKRGAGQSTGEWHTASIEQQAHDVQCVVRALSQQLPGLELGLFGHSQGSWVVAEAVARLGVEAAFVIFNSGPAMGPRVQTRYELERRLRLDPRATEVLAAYDACIGSLVANESYAQACDRHQFVIEHFEITEFDWINSQVLFGYEPVVVAPPTPVLALFGALDELVPVPESAQQFDQYTNFEVHVLADADHRLLNEQGTIVANYWHALDAFVNQQLTTTTPK